MDPSTLLQQVGEQSACTSWAQQTFKVTVTHGADFPNPSMPLQTTQSNNRKCSPVYNNSRPPVEQMPNADHQLDDFSPDAEQHEQTRWDQTETWNDMNQSNLGQDIKHEPNQLSPGAVTKPVQTAQQPNQLRPDVKHWSRNQLRPDISHWMTWGMTPIQAGMSNMNQSSSDQKLNHTHQISSNPSSYVEWYKPQPAETRFQTLNDINMGQEVQLEPNQHTVNIAFWNLPPNSDRIGYTT